MVHAFLMLIRLGELMYIPRTVCVQQDVECCDELEYMILIWGIVLPGLSALRPGGAQSK